jgi:hypothetical protein
MPSFSNDLFQRGDGNVNAIITRVQQAPVTTTDTTTLTVAQLSNGIILATPTAAATYTLPTGALMDSVTGISKAGAALDFFIINQSSTYDITLVTGTGFSQGSGTVVIPAGTSGAVKVRRTGNNSWIVYHMSGGAAASVAATLTLIGQSFSTVSGSPVNATVGGDLVKQLPDAATTEIAYTFTDAAVAQGYDCFLYISGAAAIAGNLVVLEHDIAYAASGVTPTAGANKRFAVMLSTQNTVIRYQIPCGIVRPDLTNSDFRIRLRRIGADGSDLYAGSINIHRAEFVPTPAIIEANATDSGSTTPTVYATPYDGVAVLRQYALYGPICTSDNAVYIAEPVTISTVQQSRLAKLNKSTYATIQDIQIGTNTHDSILGHRDCAVAITDTGIVLAHPESHHVPLTVTRYNSEDLSVGASVTAPTGLNTNSSYRRFFRNSFDGSIWLSSRGNSYNGYICEFTSGTTLTMKPSSGQQVAGSFSQLLGCYGLDLAFGAADTLYLLLEPFRAASGNPSGYPRQNINLIKSTDRGVTWYSMSGKLMSVSTPAAWVGNDDDAAFPNYFRGTDAGNGAGQSVSGKVGIGADGEPIIVASWRHPADTLRSTWMAKWNSSTQKWDRKRLLANNGVAHAGNPNLTYYNGKIIVCVGSTDDHDLSNAEITPADNQLYLFVNTDSGATWRRYTINHATGGYGGAYLDPQSIRIDNILRLAPRRESVPTESKIWTLPVPA